MDTGFPAIPLSLIIPFFDPVETRSITECLPMILRSVPTRRNFTMLLYAPIVSQKENDTRGTGRISQSESGFTTDINMLMRTPRMPGITIGENYSGNRPVSTGVISPVHASMNATRSFFSCSVRFSFLIFSLRNLLGVPPLL